MSRVIQGDPVRHRTDGWTGTVTQTPSKLSHHAWVARDSSADPYPELVPLTDLEPAD
ncbi:hypothetical protein [Kitasatospora brasiliensis]|uniref:hypothetical protein n=1 Tax=Kitasatospora brasiliensis TaxID=3058040 RepID=UPI0029314BEA|nr:hypothetical protein [Kitasatospora sp. K002]